MRGQQKQLSVLVLMALVSIIPGMAVAQSSDAAQIPRLVDGRPDLQGTWDYRTITPLQRPSTLSDKAVLSEEEAEAFQAAEIVRRDRDNFTDTSRTGDYNQFWYDRGMEILDDRRTSLITDPADGRIPSLTQAAIDRRQALRDARTTSIGVEARSLAERCIMGFNSGPPMLPSAYNNNVQLVQTDDYVVIHNEMVHNARIVRLGDQEHRQQPRKWEGDSIGHWDGDTLVVETRYFARETTFGNSSANMQLTERFWLVDANTLGYEFTVTDPSTWTAPWTARFPMRRSELPIYEYACHEGNYSLAGVLGGWRRQELQEELNAN